MRYLLDTCVFLWILDGNREKLKDLLPIIEDTENELLLSVVSYWEIVIKRSIGKLKISDHWTELLEQTGISWLVLEPRHVKQLEGLPAIHSDPFDRLLISQARAEKISLLTLDDQILKYL